MPSSRPDPTQPRLNARATQASFEISGHETVRPTPYILDALEKDYPLEASIADLVDNSIDARAKNVLIRFLKKKSRLTSLCVADDGIGMNAAGIRRAMQFAGRRPYSSTDLGMFGVGLKTASLSQANVLTVVSRARNSKAVGRQWTKSGIRDRDWSLNVLTSRSSERLLQNHWGLVGQIRVGTVIRWDEVDDFDRLRVGINAYLERAILRIQRHLGLKLHRFLDRRRLKIQIDVADVNTQEVGPPSPILPTNPFPPAGQSGARSYPKDFVVRTPGGKTVTMRGHIWRKKSSDDGYKLGGGKVAEHQGLYFYRHDRLIQDGGWCELIGTNEPHLSLARVEVDIPDNLKSYLKVRSNKAGVDVPATFADAVFRGRAHDGTEFRKFLKTAQEVYRRRGEQRAKPMLRPGDGIPADVVLALERKSMRFLRGQACSVVWKHLPESDFVSIDQSQRLILLNSRYRKMLLRGAHGGKTDIPLVRTLLYLTFEGLLAGDRVGPVERFQLHAIQAATNAALKLEALWARR